MAHERLLADITDTARWVAFYRALESERPDALFRDSFARRLAGPRGRRIVESTPAAAAAAPANVVRAFLFDRWIESLAAGGAVDTVLNLGAGFDTRPYRLRLPAGLRWIEADLPVLIEEKETLLSDAHPVCALERVRVDLEQGEERRDLLRHAGAASSRALVVTEGVLDYLEPGDVAALAAELAALPGFDLWLSDLVSPAALFWMNAVWGRELGAARSTKRFAPPEGPAFFSGYGWVLAGFHSLEGECQRLNRGPGSWPAWPFSSWLQPYYAAVVLLKRLYAPGRESAS